MNCLFHLLLLPIYFFIILVSIGISIIYFLFNIIIYVIRNIINIFTKKDYQKYHKPNFQFKKVIITNDNIKTSKSTQPKKQKGRIIDAEYDEK